VGRPARPPPLEGRSAPVRTTSSRPPPEESRDPTERRHPGDTARDHAYTLMEANRAQRRAARQIGAAVAAGAAAGGLLVYLRRRAHQLAAALPVDPMVGPVDAPDGREPDVVHAPGHRHRVPVTSPGLQPAPGDHPAGPPTRHQDRGGRSAAFHNRRSV